MGFISVLAFAKKLVQERIQPGDSAIDATAGNGLDTLFLAELCGVKGSVFAFDIQEEALNNTRQRLEAASGKEKESTDRKGLAPVFLHQLSHHLMEEAVPDGCKGSVAAVMFNLGYLPGGTQANQQIITSAESTLPALNAALRMLRLNGVVTVVLYPGHPGGQEEAADVQAWAEALPLEQFEVLLYRFINRDRTAPYLLAVTKRSTRSAWQGGHEAQA